MEKQFEWNDNLVNEACYFVGLNVKGHEDIIRQIPDLVDKYKQSKQVSPLFKTEDGVDKFNGDKCWYINETMEVYQCTYIQEPLYLGRIKYFDKKENAESYSKENKPKYSINDFRKIVRELADGARGRDNRSYLNKRLTDLSNTNTDSADR